MKKALLLFALVASLTLPALAQSQGSTGTAGAPPPPPKDGGGPPPGGGHMDGLTHEEHQKLMEARKAALEANPDLQDQQDALQKKIDAAMIKADPSLAPLIAKMEAAHKNHEGGPGGPPPPPEGNKSAGGSANGGTKPSGGNKPN